MVVDDEPNAVNLLEVLIGQSTSWELVARCYNSLQAISFLKNNTVDLVFLDINMPLLTGMELAALLSADTAIVFTTAHSDHAAESYTYNTLDYLLKPITLKRFLAAVKKVEAHFQPRMPAAAKEPEKVNGYFFVKSGTQLHRILLQEILFFESRKEYVRVVTQTSDVLTYRRLKDIEAQLPAPFTRVHNSYIVNIAQINRIQDNHIHIGEAQIPIGEKFKEGVMEMVRRRTI